MVCFNCGSVGVVELLGGKIKCKNCGEVVDAIHYSCKKCNSAWVTFDGVFLMGVIMDKSISVVHKKIDKTGHVVVEKTVHTMVEATHKCLRCNKMAYEIHNGVFKCSDGKCGFKWEIIEHGK
jgi:hypothetical protein